ncbi:nitroreductase [Lysobacter fragariae]
MSDAPLSVGAALEKRRSVRAFLDRPVDAGLLRRILAQAARAPSGGNLQPWRIVVLGGDELARLKAAMAQRLQVQPDPDPPDYPVYPPNLVEPYRTHRFRVGEMLYEALGIPRDDRAARLAQFANNYQLFGAPVGLFCYVDRAMGAAQWADLGMYLQSVMLLLCEHGLDSCPQEAWSSYHRVVGGIAMPPAEWMLFCGMAIGYGDHAAPINGFRAERMPLEEFAGFRGL